MTVKEESPADANITDSAGEAQSTIGDMVVDSGSVVSEDPSTKGGGNWCSWRHFDGVNDAKAFALLGTARGAVVMSNIFLSTSLIYLASEEAGCLDSEDEVIDDCDNTVKGFRPSSLISNIAVISGIMSAFLMPIIGAILDYTPHRHLIGVLSAVAIWLIQAAQIGTVDKTWFPMAIFQAFAGFIYQVQVLTAYAYLPDIAREVGEKTMAGFTATFTMVQFACQASFLLVVIIVSVALGLDDVQTGQVSQAINSGWILIGFYLGWKMFPKVPALHDLSKHNIWTIGFEQVWKTAAGINKHYKRSLRWFLLATIFAEAGANAFTVVAVIYLDEVVDMSGSEIGTVFLITLVASLPGSHLGSLVTKKTNPNTSWKLCLITFCLATISGALVLDGPDRSNLVYVWGVIWGMILGWFYPTENAFFSLILPKGQEAELSGFFVYCTQILVWLPPLLFTILNEQGVDLTWGLMSLVIFFIIAFGLLSLVAPWEEVLEETSSQTMSHIVQYADNQDKDQKDNEAEKEIEKEEASNGVHGA